MVIQTLLHIPDTDQILQDLSQRLTENGRMIIVDFLKNDEVVSDLVHSGFTESDLTIRCQQHRLILADFQPFYTGDKLFMGKTATLFVAVIQQGKQSKISL